MSNDRTDYYFYEIFANSEHKYSEEVLVRIPYSMFMKCVREFCNYNYDVNIEGTNNSIWNLFCNTNFFDDLMDDDDFVDMIREKYENSPYIKEDHLKWEESEPWEE